MKKYGVVVLAMLAISVQLACADNLDIPVSKGELVLGEWNDNFARNKAYAIDNGIPFLSFWGQNGCTYCYAFRKLLAMPEFKAWQAEKKIVMNMYECRQVTEQLENRDWTRNYTQTSFPFVRLYWSVNGRVVADDPMGGRFILSASSDADRLKVLLERLEKSLKDWKPGSSGSYAGASFVTGSDDGNSLQVLADKTPCQVYVPIARTNNVDQAGSNQYVIVKADGSRTAVWQQWGAGEQPTNLMVDVPETAGGKSMTLQFLNNDGEVVSETKINVLAEEPENSSVNPYWIGERKDPYANGTVPDLAPGEWTMDYAMATNAAARSGGYAFVYFTGAFWCPWCAGLEKDILSSAEFKGLCSEKNVYLVTMDHPTRTMAPPSLLMYEQSAKGVSGASYLSRKGISLEDAQKVIARNHDLAYAFVNAGGYARTRQQYTMFPALCLVDRNGRLVGRIDSSTRCAYDDGHGTKLFPKDANMARIRELFDLAEGDAEEELDNDWRSTKRTIGQQDAKSAKLAAVDEGDFYKVSVTAGRIAFSATGSADVQVTLELHQAAGSTDNLKKSVTAFLKDGVGLTYDITGANYYIVVKTPLSELPATINDQTGRGTPTVTTFDYTLTTDLTYVPQESFQKWGKTGEFTLEIEDEVTYRLTGIDSRDLSDGLVKVEGADDLYRATDSKPVKVKVTSATDTDGFQIWKTGEVGFVINTATTAEGEKAYQLQVSRIDGTSGKAHVKIDIAASTKLAKDRYSWPDGGVEVTWKEGEDGLQYVDGLVIHEDTFSDGDQDIVFEITSYEDSVVGAVGKKLYSVFVLTVTENDKPVIGRLAITSSNPGFAKKNTIIAKSGSKVEIGVTREIGASGIVAAEIRNPSGFGTISYPVIEGWTLEGFGWQSRHGGPDEECIVTLDLTGVAPGKTFALTLAALTPGVAVDSSRRTVNVQVVSENPPAFEVAEKGFALFRNQPVPAGLSIGIDESTIGEGAVSVSRLMGSLPAGVTATYDKTAHELVLSGSAVTAKGGEYSAVYQVKEGSVAGLTATLNFTVIDSKVGGTVGGVTYKPNTALAKTLTFTDVPVEDMNAGRLVGFLNLTVPANGRVSARFRSVEGSHSLSAKGWSGYEPEGTLKAELTGTGDWEDVRLGVAVSAGGAISCEILQGLSNYSFLFPEVLWSKTENAGKWRGYYTVDLKVTNGVDRLTGDGSLTLKMNTDAACNAGKMTYAGVMPDGRSVFGSGVLIPRDDFGGKDWTYAFLPIFTVSSANGNFTGLLKVKADAASKHVTERRCVYGVADAALMWEVPAVKACGTEVIPSSEILFEPFGTYYSGAESFADCCDKVYSTTTLKFLAELTRLAPASWGVCTGCTADGVELKVGTDNSITLKDAAADRGRLAFTFAKTTGLFSGSFKLDFEKRANVLASFKGIVLPGWGSEECGSCGLDADEKLRPFGNGSCWFTDSEVYTDSLGRNRTTTIRRSCPVHIGLEAEIPE